MMLMMLTVEASRVAEDQDRTIVSSAPRGSSVSQQHYAPKTCAIQRGKTRPLLQLVLIALRGDGCRGLSCELLQQTLISPMSNWSPR